MDRSRILCKFFAQGACLKGDHCNFSHDWNDMPNNVCVYYQRGACSFGSRCRYDHVKFSRHTPTEWTLRPSNVNSQAETDIAQLIDPYGASSDGDLALTSDGSAQSSTLGKSLPDSIAENHEVSSVPDAGFGCGVSLADQPICSFAASGSCPYGENCTRIHGDLCSFCGRQCLHPHRPDEREEHEKSCYLNSKRLETLKLSEEIECSVCFERVFSKPTASERKFGLLSECDHPFCISCIRNWRNNALSSGMDVNTAARACPVCRKLSYFVVPSVSWFSTKEEKQEIITSYKARLMSIDCKYFDFGNGACPFGTSCFYKHEYNADKIRLHSGRPRGRRPPPFMSRRGRRAPHGVAEAAVSAFEEVLSGPASLLLDEDDMDEFANHPLVLEALEHEFEDFAGQLLMGDDYDEFDDDLELNHDSIESSLGLAFLLMQLGDEDDDAEDPSSDDDLL